MTQRLKTCLARLWKQGLQTNDALDDEAYFDRDPLAHPDIQRMTESQKADLPFSASCVKPE
jgi:hypothetical protein